MRILHITNELENNGTGITNLLVDLAVSQRQAGHEVFVLSRGGSFEALLSDQGVKHRVVNISRSSRDLAGALAAIRTDVKRIAPDVMHAHTMTGAALGIAASFGRVPIVTTVHNEFQRGVILMALGDRVVGISSAVSKAMERRSLVRKSKVRTIHNGTVGTVRTPPPETVQPERLKGPSIVAVGSLKERKGIYTLLGAVERLSLPAHCYFVGNRDNSDFETAVEMSPAKDRVHLVGFRADPRPFMRGADVVVLASHDEPFGLVITEARSVGAAIIASEVGGIPEALDNGKCGLLVPARDSEALATALARVLTDSELRSRLQSAATAGLERFTAQQMAERYVDVYSEIK